MICSLPYSLTACKTPRRHHHSYIMALDWCVPIQCHQNTFYQSRAECCLLPLNNLFTLGQVSILCLPISFVRLIFLLFRSSPSGHSTLTSAIVSPSFLSELQTLRYLCLAYGWPLPSECPTWLLDPGVARRVWNSPGQQMRDCTLSRDVGSASGLTVLYIYFFKVSASSDPYHILKRLSGGITITFTTSSIRYKSWISRNLMIRQLFVCIIHPTLLHNLPDSLIRF